MRVLVLTVAVFGACSALPPSTPSPVGTALVAPISPSTSPTATATGLVGPSPTSAPSERGTEWGPVAVLSETGGMEALFHGHLDVTATCVRLNRHLVIWPAARTRWSAVDQAVAFLDSDGRGWTMRDGDRVSLGGGAVPANEKYLATLGWVNRPQDSCMTDPVLLMNSVVDVEPRAIP